MQQISRWRMTYYICIIVFACILIYFFAVRQMRFFLVPSGSMEPLLHPGDYLVTLTEGDYKRGDIVVLDDPKEDGAYIVKRIIGVAGDVLEIKDGALYLNEAYASEPYVPEPMGAPMRKIKVPEGGVFVMGDNRNHSEDSSEWQEALPVSSIVGKVILRYLPVDRARFIRSFPLRNAKGI